MNCLRFLRLWVWQLQSTLQTLSRDMGQRSKTAFCQFPKVCFASCMTYYFTVISTPADDTSDIHVISSLPCSYCLCLLAKMTVCDCWTDIRRNYPSFLFTLTISSFSWLVTFSCSMATSFSGTPKTSSLDSSSSSSSSKTSSWNF